ncbi:hypothetical protein GYMLUDRAFT_395488 [Collybiopsis luxurians FD-317 M1]|uniref:Uncharacterized protein n=1 Tax=Collybiopsis luxurians FD-317 M1 TaxID=944289 RepID=A0A0D0C9E1_9AGAR|nr:hypothetical protein GYMLUDRAFT_395488 [Collybiopsis luxurians FD-317 M1]
MPNDVHSSPTNRTLAQSWAALPASTRIKFSLGICAVAVAGMYISDLLEKQVPVEQGGSLRPGGATGNKE